jgi:uncharacterized membrane protein
MEETDGLWIRRADVWTGALLGGAAVARSFQPSLVPRSTAHQAFISGAAGAGGFALGNATFGWIARSGDARSDVARLAGASAAAGLTRALARQRSTEHLPRAATRSLADGLLAGTAAASVVVAVRNTRRPVRAALVLGGAGIAAGGVQVFLGIRGQDRHRTRHDPPAPRALPAVARSVTIGGALAAVVNGFRYSGGATARVLERRLGMAPRGAAIAGHTAAFGAWVGVVTAFVDTFVRGMALYDRAVDPGYDRPPTVFTRSAGPGSAIAFSRAGRHGRRFVLDVASPTEIERMMGANPVAEPVRVFVGFDCARSAEERVQLAIGELQRTGAFERSLLIVGSPAGTGWVNNLPFEVADFLTLGDCAGVAVQYERLPSLLALQRVGDGGRHLRLLLEAIAGALAARPAGHRPRVVVYGESLGAWAGQNAFLHGGVAALDELGVERSLWAGTPYYSGWSREMQRGQVAVPEGTLVEVEGPDGLLALDDHERARLRVVLLSNANDPIRKLGAQLLIQRPRWLIDERHPALPPELGFVPMLTGIQFVVDALNATNPTPGVFRATGHDYRLTLPRTTQLAFDLPDPGPDVWKRLMRHLQAEEAARVARFTNMAT